MLQLRSLFTRMAVAAPSPLRQLHHHRPIAPLTQLSRPLSTTVPLERGAMKKKWTTRRNRHRKINRVRARQASKWTLNLNNKFRAQVKRRQDMVKTVYEQYGINEEPLRLTEMERRELTQRYIDQGVFNEVLSMKEIHNYQFGLQFRTTMQKMHEAPRQFRPSERMPYEGVNNMIPLERMRDPSTGELYSAAEIKPYQTPRHQKESEMIAQKGFFAHERAKNAVGYASLRDTKEFDTIGRVVRLDNWVAKLPKQDPRFRRSQKFFGKRNMYFAHAGYFDRDFQMPWRFYHIHPNETIAEHKLRHPSPFSKYTAPKGWNRVGHFHRAQLMRQQLRSRMNICSVYGHFQKGRWKEGRLRRTQEQIRQLQQDKQS